MKKLRTKTEMLIRNGPVIKSVESVLRLEGILLGKISERGRFYAGSKRKRESWMVRVVS